MLNRIDTYRNDAQWEYNNGSYSYICIMYKCSTEITKKKKMEF